jgi:hypothetical protein
MGSCIGQPLVMCADLSAVNVSVALMHLLYSVVELCILLSPFLQLILLRYAPIGIGYENVHVAVFVSVSGFQRGVLLEM